MVHGLLPTCETTAMTSSDQAPKTNYLRDYTVPDFLIDSVDLDVELDEARTRVRARLSMRRNPLAPEQSSALVLDGQELELLEVAVDGQPLDPGQYTLDDHALTIPNLPDAFVVSTRCVIRPAENTSLEGLYLSNGIFCTQCEAEGFRKITWFLDRPDVMAQYSTTVHADRAAFPMLLSNGNPVARGDDADGRHWVRWEDPFAKPSYLFALVAGELSCVEDSFMTRSNRAVALRIYVEPHNADKCAHAMASLKRAMRWEEDQYGLEYDLDIFMIVAVDDFNMGAMENKGLNVFNSKFVLAKPETATDADFAGIEGVIAHEYFHNWTGNRVTCRDWFQLSLKEGLTVFRDQQFSADMTSAAVKRIQDVRVLRTHQFAEDSGPMAHPVRPQSYIEINNFYTITVYEKGAEVIRMMHTLLGARRFREGIDLYFTRHDGQAVTTDDFVAAMEDASGVDLKQFRLWYDQAGTPRVSITEHYDADSRELVLKLTQSCPATPGQNDKLPLHIPVRLALLDDHGRELPLDTPALPDAKATEMVYDFTEAQAELRFRGLSAKPVVSVGRQFSAPVRFDLQRSDAELVFLLGSDTDPFNRWDAAQTYTSRLLLRLIETHNAGRQLALPDDFVAAIAGTLSNGSLDKALIAEALTLPSESYLGEQMAIVDVDAIHTVRQFVRRSLASRLGEDLSTVYRANLSNEPYRYSAEAAGRRRLKNLCLSYLLELDDREVEAWAIAQVESSDNMTDVLAAMAGFANIPGAESARIMAAFRDRWADDSLVLDKWFALQAISHLPDTLTIVKQLMNDAAFDIRKPNKVRALVGAFCHGNQVRFHHASGEGYRFLADRVIEIDALNPQIAARLLGVFSRWRRFDQRRQALLKSELERVLTIPNLSKDTYEVASKSLG